MSEPESSREPIPVPGRPPIPLDYETAYELGELSCTMEECARMMRCSEATLYRDKTFCEAFKEGKAHSHKSLRRKQMELAMKGNVGMLVWLGKQWLYQKERAEIEHKGGIDLTGFSREELVRIIEGEVINEPERLAS